MLSRPHGQPLKDSVITHSFKRLKPFKYVSKLNTTGAQLTRLTLEARTRKMCNFGNGQKQP